MSRQSQNALTVTPASLPSRLEPPAELDETEATFWRAVVATKPVEWFEADSAPLLAEYCRAKIMCDVLAGQVAEALKTGEPDVIRKVLDMRDKESRRLLSLGTRLRLTQQSRYTPKAGSTANRKVSAAKPWQTGK
jgi:hypothetical protein